MKPLSKYTSATLTAALAVVFLLCFAAPAYAVTEFIGRLFSDWLGHFPGLASGAGFLLWFFLRNDKKISPIAGFHPPDGLTPADAVYIMNGEIRKSDVIPLIICWANKGYIRVSEITERDGFAGGNGFLLSKLREIDKEAKSYEKELFNMIFSRRSGDQVTTFALAEEKFDSSLYKTAKAVVHSHDKSFGIDILRDSHVRDSGTNIFKLNPLKGNFKQVIRALLIGVPTIVCVWYMIFTNFAMSVTNNNVLKAALVALFVGGIYMPIFLLMRLKIISMHLSWKHASVRLRIQQTFDSIFLLVFFSIHASVFMGLRFFSPWSILEILDITAPLALMYNCRHRTKLGLEYLAQLTGFKDFLENAGAGKIQWLANENPRYFYDILPYAMALGAADKWAKKFDHVGLQPPEWYKGSEARFTPSSFVSGLTKGLSELARERRG